MRSIDQLARIVGGVEPPARGPSSVVPLQRRLEVSGEAEPRVPQVVVVPTAQVSWRVDVFRNADGLIDHLVAHPL